MIQIIRTTSSNSDFLLLVKALDQLLAILDGEDHAFYAQFNKPDALKQAIVAYEENTPVGCGAFKELDATTVEVKRMFVNESLRNKGIATKVLLALEEWALELGYTRCILETGIRQPDAIALYKKNGYRLVENFGQYAGVNTSVCFEKRL